MRTLVAAITILAGAFAAPVFAASASGKYAIEGPGRLSCGEFSLLTPDSVGYREQAIWLSGYITAHNRLTPETYDLSTWQSSGTLLALLGQYCQANPQAPVENGARELIGYLLPDRLVEENPTIRQGSGTSITVIYVDTAERASRALAEAGYPTGSTEADLETAIRNFQKANGIADTGIFDQGTLARLIGK